MANSYPGSGQVILDDLKVCTSTRLQPHFVSYGEHMFMNLESAHSNSYLPVLTFSRAGCTLGAVQLERCSNSDSLGSYSESEMIIGTRANTPTSIQTNGVRRINITNGGNVGIGTSSPNTPLQIRNSSVSSGGSGLSVYGFDGAMEVYTTRAESPANAAIYLYNRPTSGTNGTGTGISFRASSTNTADRAQGGFYSSWTDTTDATRTSKFFFDLVCNGTYTTRMTLLGTGHLGVGTTTPGARVDVCGADGRIQSRVDSSDGSTINVRPNAGKCGWISYTEDAVADRWGIGVKNGDAKLYFASGNVGSDGGTTRMIIDGGGCVGINTTTPSYRLHVNGTFYSAGSSVDYKQGICNYNTDSCLFMCLKPVTYQYKDEYTHLGKELKSETQIGLIAEEVAETYPELAILVNEDEQKVVRNVDYEKLSIILLSEVQKLRKEVDNLKNNK